MGKSMKQLNIKCEWYCLECMLYEHSLVSMMDGDIVKAKCPVCCGKYTEIRGDELRECLLGLKYFLSSVTISEPAKKKSNKCEVCYKDVPTVTVTLSGVTHYSCHNCVGILYEREKVRTMSSIELMKPAQ